MNGAYGTSSWGGISVATGVVRATPRGPNLIEVELSSAPLAVSPYGVGDALNPLTWTLTRGDTGAALILAEVTKVTELRFRIQVVDTLGGDTVTHTLYYATLVSPMGVRAVPPRFVTFVGLPLEPFVPPAQLARPIDLAGFGIPNRAGTTLYVGPDGDYATQSGVDLVTKLILRRVTTPKGAFRHLPQYGDAPGVKNRATDADLQATARNLERSVRKEPEVERASVSFSRSSTGVVKFTITARVRDAKLPIQIVLPYNPGVSL